MRQKNSKTELVYAFLQEHQNECFSSKALIADKRVNASEAAVYRALLKLTEEGRIKKFISGKGEGVFYQYNNLADCHGHFHLKCLECGRIQHVDCSVLNEMEKHIDTEHAFWLDNTKTVLYGLCADCRGKGK